MYGPRASDEPAPGLRQVNAHVDIVAWRQGKRFIGEDEALRLALIGLSVEEPSAGSLITPCMTRRLDFLEKLFTWKVRAGSRLRKCSRILRPRMADLLTVRDLKVYLDVDAGTVKAVDGVSFRIPAGRTVALVGESGSGKSVVAQSIMSILPRIARIESGEIVFRDPERRPGTEIDISRLDPAGREMQDIRGGRISIIFQEPMTALSPLHTIGNQITEALALHQPGSASASAAPPSSTCCAAWDFRTR